MLNNYEALTRDERFFYRSFQLTQSFISSLFVFNVGMSWRADKLNVTFVFALVIVLVTFKHGHGADVVGVHSASNLQISSRNSLQSNDGNIIAAKMLHIRQTVKSLFSNWSLGESGLQGKTIFIDSLEI